MFLLVVILFLLLLNLLVVRYGVDSRDGRDWQRLGRP